MNIRFLEILYLSLQLIMKKEVYLFTILLLLSACGKMSISERLNQIDSLIVKEQYDSAHILLNNLNNSPMTVGEQAQYNLLSTQLGYLTNHPLPTDSLLDLSIAYYDEVGNNEKLADCYYYKSCRSRIEQNYPQAILYSKEAERLAINSGNTKLRFKIMENLAYLNGLCDNDVLQLQYAKKALAIAQSAKNNNWIVYSYNKLTFAFANLDQFDSAFYYIEKSIPYFKYVYDQDKREYLANIGLLYKDKDPSKAKEYFEKALVYGEHPGIYENLADIYYSRGEKEEAYKLWKKALTIDGRYGKDNIFYNIITYDVKRGKLDEICKNVDEIIAIKDSIINKVKNDTIKDLQMRFDHEVAMHEADKRLIVTQRILLGFVLLLAITAFYIFIRIKKEEARQREYQMQLYAYTTEIHQLTISRDKALTQIQELEGNKNRDLQKICQLEDEVKNAEAAIQRLNKSIKKLLHNEAPKLKQGKMLYEHIMEGKTAVNWRSKEEELFNNYYAATNYQNYNRLKKVERVTKLSAHNMFYLILKEIGKDDNEIRRIMALSREGLRSIRARTKPKEKGST